MEATFDLMEGGVDEEGCEISDIGVEKFCLCFLSKDDVLWPPLKEFTVDNSSIKGEFLSVEYEFDPLFKAFMPGPKASWGIFLDDVAGFAPGLLGKVEYGDAVSAGLW